MYQCPVCVDLLVRESSEKRHGLDNMSIVGKPEKVWIDFLVKQCSVQ